MTIRKESHPELVSGSKFYYLDAQAEGRQSQSGSGMTNNAPATSCLHWIASRAGMTLMEINKYFRAMWTTPRLKIHSKITNLDGMWLGTRRDAYK